MEENSMEMSHDEVWDDSALIDSWNQALDEYNVRTRAAAHGDSVSINHLG
jgi:hypothetical protein